MRPRYRRRKAGGEDWVKPSVDCHPGRPEQTLTGSCDKTRIAVRRTSLVGGDGKTFEWRSQSLRAYQRPTKAAETLIEEVLLSGCNTRRALNSVFKGAVGKDVNQPRLAQGDWDAWNARSLAEEPRRTAKAS